jgi:putative ABC transport system permease protein
VLFTRTLQNLAAVDPGFRHEDVLVADFDTRPARVPPERQAAFARGLRERIAAITGVAATATAAIEPASGSIWNDRVIVDGVAQQTMTNVNRVSPGFFQTLGTPLVGGRDFDDRDTAAAPFVAIVNEAFAEQLLKTKGPVGRAFRLQVSPGDHDPLYEVIGVARNTKYSDVREPVGPIVYFPEAQEINPTPVLVEVQVLVRASGSPAELTAAVTAAAREINPGLLVSYRTIAGDIRRSFLRERLMATLSGFFAALAAALATIGLYGVMSYVVARRRNEIGIRIVLGAEPREVVRMIMLDAGGVVAAGLAIGALLSLAVARSANALLFGIQPHDPATLAAAAASLAAVAAVASYLPARAAARLDPTAALRDE